MPIRLALWKVFKKKHNLFMKIYQNPSIRNNNNANELFPSMQLSIHLILRFLVFNQNSVIYLFVRFVCKDLKPNGVQLNIPILCSVKRRLYKTLKWVQNLAHHNMHTQKVVGLSNNSWLIDGG